VVPANVAASRVGEDFGVPFELIGYELLLNRSRVDANVESCKCRSEILYDAKLAPETGTRAGHNSQDKSLPLYRVYCIEAGEPGSVVSRLLIIFFQQVRQAKTREFYVGTAKESG
jgi:hypothetical protein